MSDAHQSDKVMDRIVTVSGKRDQIAKAVALMCTSIVLLQSNSPQKSTSDKNSTLESIRTDPFSTQPNNHHHNSHSNPYLDANLSGLKESMLQSVQLSISLLIPTQRMGLIIGKAGKTLTEIQQKSGVLIKCQQDVLPGSTERCCVLTGVVDSVHIAVWWVLHHIESTTPFNSLTNNGIKAQKNDSKSNQSKQSYCERSGNEVQHGVHPQEMSDVGYNPHQNYTQNYPQNHDPSNIEGIQQHDYAYSSLHTSKKSSFFT